MSNTALSIPLDAEILSRTPPEVIELLLRLLAENQALREENRLLREEVANLRARIEELEAKLNRNSSNSNKPLSSDSPLTSDLRQRRKPKSHVSVSGLGSNVCALRNCSNCIRKNVHAAVARLRNKRSNRSRSKVPEPVEFIDMRS